MSNAELLRCGVFIGSLVLIAYLDVRVLARILRAKLGKAGPKSVPPTALDKALYGRAGSATLAGVTVVLLLCALYGKFIEPRRIGVSHVVPGKGIVKEDGLGALQGVKIVHISDMHVMGMGPNERNLPAIVNALEPDLIVFTGDYLNVDGAAGSLEEVLAKLEAEHGKYGILGNFDNWHNPVRALRNAGVELLDGKTVRLEINGLSIFLMGVPYRDADALRRLSSEAREGDFSIVLHHSPDLIEEAAPLGVDLYLCGHTHGGQVRLPFYGALITLSDFGKRYEMGYYEVGDTVAYVSRGIGTEGSGIFGIRFLCPPEVVAMHAGM